MTFYVIMLHITHSSVETGACPITSVKTVLCCHSTFFLALTSTSMDLHWLESHDGALRPSTPAQLQQPARNQSSCHHSAIETSYYYFVFVAQSKNLQKRWKIIGINGWDRHHNRIGWRGIWKRDWIREIRNIVWRHDCQRSTDKARPSEKSYCHTK